jgi:hypothetical protein
MTRKRLSSALTDVLRGEVDPKTLEVEVLPAAGAGAIESEQRLEVTISYRLATINREETHTVAVGSGDSGG